jgi:NAD(P)-dependent dehydrogenase (short-subunit alcohol dehydrogenase family)
MTNHLPRLLLLLGSGPGIGVSVASRFARSHFSAVALVARNGEQLSKDRATVLAAASEAGRAVEVRTWQADISDLSLLEKTLKEVEEFGSVECVYFNAARVAPSPLLEFPDEEIEADFRVRSTGTTLKVRRNDLTHLTSGIRSLPIRHCPLGHAPPHQKRPAS